MSLTRSIAHNTAIQLVGKIISTALGVLAFVVMSRALGVEKFGWYATATGFLQFIAIISDFGFTVTASNLLSEPGFNKSTVLQTVFSWRLASAALFQAIAPLIMLLLPYPAPIKLATFILTISFFFVSVSQVFIGWYRAELALAVVTWSELIGRLALLGGLLLMAYTGRGFLPMTAVVTFASLVSTLYLIASYGKVKIKFDRAVSAALFHKIWPTALSVIFNAVYLQADRVILPLYASQTSVGLYGASYRVLDIVLQMAAMVMGITMPLITFAWSRGLMDEFRRRYQMSFDLLSLILLPTLFGAVILSTPLLRLAGGGEFAAGGPILRLLSWSIFGTCFGMCFGHIALSINRQKEALWIYGSDAILSLLGYFIFIPRFGAWGAAGVTIFSELYAGAGLMLLTIRYSGFTPRFWTFGKITLASALMAISVRAVQPLNIFLSIALGGLVYAALIFAFRTISLSTIREVAASGKVADKPPV